MTRWQRFLLNLQLSSLYGRERALGRQIGAGYARGDYQSKARREQQGVRAEIRRIERELDQ